MLDHIRNLSDPLEISDSTYPALSSDTKVNPELWNALEKKVHLWAK